MSRDQRGPTKELGAPGPPSFEMSDSLAHPAGPRLTSPLLRDLGPQRGSLVVESTCQQGGRFRRGGMISRTALLGAVLVSVLGFPASSSSAATSGLSSVIVYSVPIGVQFINSADDAVRGKINNPFGAAVNKLAPPLASSGNGPDAGDVAVYGVNLYAGKTLQRRAGSGVYTCYFNYSRTAFCEAYYELAGASTLVASGPIDFSSSGFTIVITGGTKKYLGARGEVRVVAAPRNAQRIDFRLLRDRGKISCAVVVVMALVVAAGGGEARAAGQVRLTIFAVPATVQFLNHADDRLRGMSTNPFNVAKSLVIVSGGVEKGNGPFPGDDVLYNFRLYSSPAQKRRLGSAIFTCYYNFSKDAICNSYFDLNHGLDRRLRISCLQQRPVHPQHHRRNAVLPRGARPSDLGAGA